MTYTHADFAPCIVATFYFTVRALLFVAREYVAWKTGRYR